MPGVLHPSAETGGDLVDPGFGHLDIGRIKLDADVVPAELLGNHTNRASTKEGIQYHARDGFTGALTGWEPADCF